MSIPTTITPKTMRRLCTAARSVPCGHCAAPPGQPCVSSRGQEGYHLARFARACKNGLITSEGMAAAIMAAGPVFTPATLITGGAS